jgi:hypothetical protein
MTDLISRADAIDAVRSAISEEWLLREAIVTDIKALPSADAVQGEWIDINGVGLCNQCHKAQLFMTPYCPNCGERMKGGDSE